MAKKFKRGDSTPISYLICFLASVISIPFFSLIMALVASMTENPGGLTNILSLGSLLLSGAFCGVFSVKFHKQGSVGFSALVSLGVMLVMLICCLIIVGAKIPVSALMNYACYIGVASFCAFMTKRIGGKKRRKKR